MVKKAMILAAGLGRRMLPLSDKCPKPLLKVAGTPLIVYHIKALVVAGVEDIVINLWHLGEKIKNFLGDGSQFGVKLHYSWEQQLLNTGGGIANALPLLGKRPFIVVSADIRTDYSFIKLAANLQREAHIILVRNPPYHPKGDFYLQDGVVVNKGIETYTFANIGIFTHEFFIDAPLGVFPLGGLLRKKIARNLVTGEMYYDRWYNVGTPEELQYVNKVYDMDKV